MSLNSVRLTLDPLSVEEAVRIVSHPSCGAVSVFIGLTRADPPQSPHSPSPNSSSNTVCVQHLVYEAYESMAIKEMLATCAVARGKWPSIHGIAMFHRLGTVPVQEASVVVAVASPHRADSLESLAFLIDGLKSRVPIWKKECFSDGTAEWKENSEYFWKRKPQHVDNQ